MVLKKYTDASLCYNKCISIKNGIGQGVLFGKVEYFQPSFLLLAIKKSL